MQSQLSHYYLRLVNVVEQNLIANFWEKLQYVSLAHTNSTYDTGYWTVTSPWKTPSTLDKNKCVIENISHHKQEKKQIQTKTWKRVKDRGETRPLYSPLPLILTCYPALSKTKRQINIVIHNFRLNSPCFYCLHVLFWAIQSAVTVTNASQSIAGEISELTSGMFFFPPFVFSSKMDREWSNGAKHIKRRQSSTNTIKPWSRNYFPRRGSIAVQMFLQFRVSCHKPLNALK